MVPGTVRHGVEIPTNEAEKGMEQAQGDMTVLQALNQD